VARVDELVDGIYRISTTVQLPDTEFQFNQFLIDDERPALVHTGIHGLYEGVRDGVAEVLDPSKLEYVILLHFEADENGGMDRFLDGAPSSTLACSALSAILNLSGWNYSGRVEGHAEGEVIDLGKQKLRFLETPHVHHWDSMMLFDETTKSVFPSDLFIQPGDQPPVVTEDLGGMMCEYYRQIGIFAHDQPVRDVVDRIGALDPDWITACTAGAWGERRSPTSSARCGRSRSVIKQAARPRGLA
jgi:flavorubredoxin